MTNRSNTSHDEYDEWFKIGEAARALGVSTNSIRKLVREGHLKAYRVRGLTGVQFKRDDVYGLLEEVKPDEIEDAE